MVRRAVTRASAAGTLAALVVGASLSACGAGDSGPSAENETLIVGIDLPLQGASKDASDATIKALELYLGQRGGRAGPHRVTLKVYDDATAAKGSWDDAQCAKNAQEHVTTDNEIAVVGTYNSGCAKIQVPVLNQDPNGPLLMVSHANTNPGLTRKWDPGEPEKYYPTGRRNYARVIATDEHQGAAAAQFAAADLNVKRCYIIDDNQTYGQGVARVFAAEALRQGITVLGEQSWDARQPTYEALFTQIKNTDPDCVYVAGIVDNNGGQLVKDKVKVLGDNTVVKLLAPDGFTGFPDFLRLPQAQGMYLTFAGLSSGTLRSMSGTGGRFLDAYRATYGADPPTNYAIYAVQALQVILEAIARSDGSRKGVIDQVFSGPGISISAAESMLGKDLKIDPATGDISVRDITIEVIRNDTEELLKAWPIG